MENLEKDTLLNLETVLNTVNGMRQEMNDSISGMRQEMNLRFDNIEVRLTNVERDVEEIKYIRFVFENEFDRLLALSYKSLELSHENRADVRIMRKEIIPWSSDVRKLEKKFA